MKEAVVEDVYYSFIHLYMPHLWRGTWILNAIVISLSAVKRQCYSLAWYRKKERKMPRHTCHVSAGQHSIMTGAIVAAISIFYSLSIGVDLSIRTFAGVDHLTSSFTFTKNIGQTAQVRDDLCFHLMHTHTSTHTHIYEHTNQTRYVSSLTYRHCPCSWAGHRYKCKSSSRGGPHISNHQQSPVPGGPDGTSP